MPSFWLSLSALILLPASIHALTLDCNKIRDDGQEFNFKALGGPKTVHNQVYIKLPPTISNTTFTIDICKPLEKKKKEEDCPNGTRVCAKEWQYRKDTEFLESVIPVAGEFTSSNGRKMDPKFTRLKGSASNSDDKEGVIIELHGGKDDKTKTTQKAIIEFLCDADYTGNEGFDGAESLMDVSQYGSMGRRADDDDEDAPELPDLDKGKALQFVSYKMDDDVKVLRLRWKTKLACEGAANDGGKNGAGWGFFTWLIIIVFLLAASYIIFGSWLNYNRYGARGWDLIPHGDTIRDIPYIVKDLGANVVERLRGGDSRGGYSAV